MKPSILPLPEEDAGGGGRDVEEAAGGAEPDPSWPGSVAGVPDGPRRPRADLPLAARQQEDPVPGPGPGPGRFALLVDREELRALAVRGEHGLQRGRLREDEGVQPHQAQPGDGEEHGNRDVQ